MIITQDEKRRNQLKVNRLRKKYRSQDKRIDRLHGVLKRDAYDYPKKIDMVTFGHEIRSSIDNGRQTGSIFTNKKEKMVLRHTSM